MLLALVTAHASPLPALLAEKERVTCRAPVSASVTKPHPGAEQFYAGTFRVDANGTVAGDEQRFLFANTAWKALGGLRKGEDCVDVWTVVGKRVPVLETCPSCAFAIEIAVDIDASRTTCTRRLTPNGNHFRTTYQIAEKPDGSIDVYFQSGKLLGKGRKDADAYAWTSEQTCTWF